MDLKFLFILPQHLNINDVLDEITSINGNIKVCKKITNDSNYIDIDSSNKYYLDNTTINTAIKNNAMLFAISNVNLIEGVTIDDYQNSNIVVMTYSEFNNIPTNLLLKHHDNFVIVWIDTKKHLDNKVLKNDIREVNYITNKINEHNFKYIYFLDEDSKTMSNVILDYFIGDDLIKNTILEEYC